MTGLLHKPNAYALLLQVACVNSEMNKLNTTLEQDSLLAVQHQLALQAQISEAQARVKVNTYLRSHYTGTKTPSCVAARTALEYCNIALVF